MLKTKKNIITELHVFKNRFGHIRAGWRILIYITLVVIISKLLDLFENSFLLLQGNSLSDYALLWNRLADKSLQLLAVFIPGIALLKWVDKRPIPLLGIGLYNGALRELSTGMLTGFMLIITSVAILWLTGAAYFSLNVFSLSSFLYLISVFFILFISAAYEEILFRGYIFQSLIEGSNLRITLSIYSLLFGVAHLSNNGITILSIAITILAGALLGVIYYKTRALWMCIGLHSIWNWTMGPLFGMGLSESIFLRGSIFSFNPSDSIFIREQNGMSDIVLGILLLALTIYIWKASWLNPSDYNRNLWSKYPPQYGAEPEVGS